MGQAKYRDRMCEDWHAYGDVAHLHAAFALNAFCPASLSPSQSLSPHAHLDL